MRLPQEFYKLAKMDAEKVVKKLSPLVLQSLEKKAEEDEGSEDALEASGDADPILVEDVEEGIGQ